MDKDKEKDIALIQEKMLGCGTFIWNKENPDFIDWSDGMYALLNMEREVITVETLKGLIVQVDYEDTLGNFNYNTNLKNKQFDLLHRVRTGNGRIKKINERLRCEYNDAGELVEVIGVCLDLSFNNQRDYTTRLNDEKFFRLFGDAPIGISLLRTDGTCFLCNESFVENVSYKEYELKDLPFQTLIHEEDQFSFVNLYKSMAENQIPSFRNEFRVVNKKGEKVWNDITVSSVKDIYENVKYIIVMLQPSQRNKKSGARKGAINTIREELTDLSLRDSLSGLYNRQYALRRLKELILVFYEKNLAFSSLLIDVDHINHINEKYGYDCGDKIIHDLSEIFKDLTRETDICARWGGEEFIILFPEMDIETAMILAERLRNEVKNTIMMWEGQEIQVTVSVSATSYTSDDTLKTFINKVDKALYEDKETHRDSVRRI